MNSTKRTTARYFINDKAKGQDMNLANFRSYFNERYSIIDRWTGLEVDEAGSQYEARQALALARMGNVCAADGCEKQATSEQDGRLTCTAHGR